MNTRENLVKNNWSHYDKHHYINTQTGMIISKETNIKDIKVKDIKGFDILIKTNTHGNKTKINAS